MQDNESSVDASDVQRPLNPAATTTQLTICTSKLYDRVEASKVVDAKCQMLIVCRIGVSIHALRHCKDWTYTTTSSWMPLRRYLTSLFVLAGVMNLGAMRDNHPRFSRNTPSDPSRNDRSGYKKDVSGGPSLWVQYLTVYGSSCLSLSLGWRVGPHCVPGDGSSGCSPSSFMAQSDFDLPSTLDWLVGRKLIMIRLTEVQYSATALQRLFCRRVASCRLLSDAVLSVGSRFSCQHGPEVGALRGGGSTFRRGILTSPTFFPSSCPCRVPSIICLLIEGFYAPF